MTGPSVFGLPHLSEDAVAAFADGVLSANATGRARKHCAECAECSDAVRGQREAAMLLRTASAPSLPAGLLDRLAGLPMSAPLPPPLSGLPTTLDANGVPVFIAYQRQRPDTEPEADAGPADRSVLEPAAARPVHRRVLLPVSILASAAAVVAAGTIGGNVGSLQPAVDQPPAVNFAPGLASVQQSNTGPNTGQQATSIRQAGSASFAFSGPLIQPASLFMPAPLRPTP